MAGKRKLRSQIVFVLVLVCITFRRCQPLKFKDIESSLSSGGQGKPLDNSGLQLSRQQQKNYRGILYYDYHDQATWDGNYEGYYWVAGDKNQDGDGDHGQQGHSIRKPSGFIYIFSGMLVWLMVYVLVRACQLARSFESDPMDDAAPVSASTKPKISVAEAMSKLPTIVVTQDQLTKMKIQGLVVSSKKTLPTVRTQSSSADSQPQERTSDDQMPQQASKQVNTGTQGTIDSETNWQDVRGSADEQIDQDAPSTNAHVEANSSAAVGKSEAQLHKRSKEAIIQDASSFDRATEQARAAARGEDAGVEWLEEACVICLEDWKEGDQLVILPCGHLLHHTCANHWANIQARGKERCPQCQAPMFSVE